MTGEKSNSVLEVFKSTEERIVSHRSALGFHFYVIQIHDVYFCLSMFLFGKHLSDRCSVLSVLLHCNGQRGQAGYNPWGQKKLDMT